MKDFGVTNIELIGSFFHERAVHAVNDLRSSNCIRCKHSWVSICGCYQVGLSSNVREVQPCRMCRIWVRDENRYFTLYAIAHSAVHALLGGGRTEQFRQLLFFTETGDFTGGGGRSTSSAAS